MRIKRLASSKFFKLFKLLFVLLVLFIGYQIVIKPRLSQKEITAQKPTPTKPAKATTEVNKSFEFEAPRVGQKGTEAITFTIVSAELKDEIKVKGVPRKADKGELYLLLRLEIENETTDKLSLTSNDFIRLVDEEGKKFAPDFHNATVIVDPLSVRKDLASFVVDEKIRSYQLLIGELEEEKETVEINF